MKLEAIVHPTSISQHDNYFDPSIHIAEEVLSSEEFKQKMVGLPVTAYHHDTMKAVHLIQKRRKELSGENMRMALIELHKNLPSSLQLARQLLKKKNIAATAEHIWNILPEVIAHARGPGVLGTVTKFWRQGNMWMVEIEIDTKSISSFQMKLIKKGGALGEISLTHAVLNGKIEPLEVSFTIQGLRTGSAINRIISASRKSSFYNIMADLENLQNAAEVTETETGSDQPVEVFYKSLNEEQQTNFRDVAGIIKRMSVKANSVAVAENEKRLMELEKAMNLVQEATATALNELGPSCFGNIPQRSQEDWKKDPVITATANQFILAAAANNIAKRKRGDEDMDEIMKDLKSKPVIVNASRSKTTETPSEDEFFRELRTMRNALKQLP